jgi:two-component system, chemotaxis family, CheB/CheR fusion protein
LLENISRPLGMAYVIILHLSPGHESILPEILARKTFMPVHAVENGMEIKKDNIYVIPPNTFMGVYDGRLTLSVRVKSGSTFHPIDFFFKSLATVYKNKAIGVILSGTASDGTIGLQAIKESGGITFAQDDSAKFSEMPNNASQAGFVDFILSPETIASELASLVKLPYVVKSPNEILSENESELRKIFVILNTRRGVDFSHYKQTTITRRILRRMTLNRLKRLEDYTMLLRGNNAEVDQLYQDLLINVTSFFREPAVYKALSQKIFPLFIKERKANDPLRIWIPGCATGEEAYSLAICLYEFLGDNAITTPIQIFSTDLNEVAITRARTGTYHPSALQNVSAQRLKRFFIKTDGEYQVIKSIRDICIFATHNLLKDPPFSRMDLISCQNVMIYLEPAEKNIAGLPLCAQACRLSGARKI